jgi:hypothetical protein
MCLRELLLLMMMIIIIIIIIIIIAFMYEKLRVPALNVDFQEPRILKCVEGDALFRVHTKVDCWVAVCRLWLWCVEINAPDCT